ncbi:MAG: beta-galactosidase [Phycisphaerales bacterium]|nr:beta-galactosidase [Phycisphaerales bacterium]
MTPRTLRVAGNGFVLNDQPFRLMGGAMHYARIPQAAWRDRFEKLIDLGCNTVETYGFWNAHEPCPGQFDFEGMLDVVRFVELAGEMGLNVIYRPGPYACAEWDMGGLPWWLLNHAGLQIRCHEPSYLQYVEQYWTELMRRLAPLQSTRGGPIIAMQIENEYGYYGNDQKYLQHLKNLLRKLGIDVMLFTSDGTFQKLTIANGGLVGDLRTANFGSRAVDRFNTLREVQPSGPLVCMEFWIGWFDEWRTGTHATRSAEDTAKELDDLLALPDSHAVIYMFQGGTNWGFTAGGNDSGEFKPFVTSYDYDALLSEAGDTTPKYEACRDVVRKHLNIDRPKRAFAPSRKHAYGPLKLTESVSLSTALATIAKPTPSAAPLTMEQLGHGRGFVVYSTMLSANYRGLTLNLPGMHDWCHVRLAGRSLGTGYRRDPQPVFTLDFEGDAATLEILVHNLARSNFGHRVTEPKGLTQTPYVGPTEHDGRALFGWTNQSLPLEKLPPLPFKATPATAAKTREPGFHRDVLTIDAEPADTFLALTGFQLGCAFINGFNIGRYWNVGPQQTLFVPASFLKRGENEIVVFDAIGCETPTIEFRDGPELNAPVPAQA